MQFVVIAHDRTDPGAKERRLARRDAHIALGMRNLAAGHLLYGVALLDEAGEMRGSVLVTEYDTRADLDAWLAGEPYVTGEVWQGVEVLPCRVGPMFAGPKPAAGAAAPGEGDR